MTWHLEYLSGGHHHRTGGYVSEAAADSALGRLVLASDPDFLGAAVFEGGAIRHGAGEIRLIITESGDRISVEDLREPTWWANLSPRHRERLAEGPSEALPADLIAALVDAGGAPTSAQWVGQPSEGFRLSQDDQDWLEAERVRRRLS